MIATRYAWIGYTAARSSLAYAGELVARIVFMTSILYVFMRLWAVVYKGVGAERLGGLTFPQMLWYLAVTEAMTLSTSRVWAEVDQDVRTGRLSVRLIHPVSYVLSHFGKAMGERLVRFAVNIAVGCAIALLLVGPIPVRLEGLAMFAILLPLAFTLDFLGHFLVGLGAFWLESTAGLALLYTRAVMLMGGMLLPFEMYPEVLQPVLRALPFGGMIHAPARMFVDPAGSLLRDAIVHQALAVLVFSGLVLVVQNVAFKRLLSNGG